MNENETNWFESRWRSWQPRHPSAGLKRRIFGAQPEAHRLLALSLRWLAPAAACLLLAVTAMHQASFSSSGARRAPMLMASNQSWRAFQPDNAASAQNRILHVTFGWTNLSGSTSSIDSFSQGRIN